VRSALIVALLTAIFTSVPAAQAAPGDLDTTFAGFGTGGVVTASGLRDINGMAVQPGGKIVVVGSAGSLQLAVYRYLPNGALDGTFGNSGKAIFPNMFTAEDVAVQSDGRIVVGGTRSSDYQLARLTASGALDTSFAQDGWAEDFDSELNNLRAILVRADGTIVACGDAYVGGDYDFGVVRYTAEGKRDLAFGGGDGKVTIGFGGEDYCEDVAQQNDGKLILLGLRNDVGAFGDGGDFAVARLEINGSLDNDNGDGGFDGDGKLKHGNNYRLANFSNGASVDTGLALALAPDGKIVVAGNAWNGSRQVWGVARWNANGAPDTSFDTDGKVFVDFTHFNAAKAVVVQPDGKIIVGGDYNGDFFLQRLLENGERDGSFGINGGGYNFTDMGGADSITALALAPNGWLYAAGYTSTFGPSDFALAQYRPDGTLAECQSGQIWPPLVRV
jgi:uncharacterized delta-60 repeat protein